MVLPLVADGIATIIHATCMADVVAKSGIDGKATRVVG